MVLGGECHIDEEEWGLLMKRELGLESPCAVLWNGVSRPGLPSLPRPQPPELAASTRECCPRSSWATAHTGLGSRHRAPPQSLDLFNSFLAFLGSTPGQHGENRLAVPLSDLA